MRPGRHQPHHYYRKKRGIIEHTSRFPRTHRVSARPSPLSVRHLLCLFFDHNIFRICLDSSMSSTFRYKVDRSRLSQPPPEFDAPCSLPYTPIPSCTLLSHRLAFLEPLASRPPAHTQTLLSVPEERIFAWPKLPAAANSTSRFPPTKLPKQWSASPRSLPASPASPVFALAKRPSP